MSDFAVEMWAVDKPQPYENNPRQITPDAITKTAESIREYGWQQPLVVDEDGVILVGHTRLMAAQSLGYGEVPVHVAAGLSEAQKRGYRIADNRTGTESRWDFPLLTGELKLLDDVNFQLTKTAFDPGEIDDLLKFELEPEEGLTDEDALPEEAAATISVEGDIWVLGNHRVMCGDSTSIDAVDKLTAGATIDIVHTDPPYGIQEKGMREDRGGSSLGSNSKLPDFDDETTDAAREAFNVCAAMGIARQVWWGANYYAHALPETASWLVWDKRVEEKQKNTESDCELAWVKSKWASVRIFRHLWKGAMKDSERSDKRIHPTQKPVALVEWVFDYFREGSTVLDLFGGSGSTLIACERRQKQAFLMEKEPYYADVIVRRWQDFTGKQAVLEATGEPFGTTKKEGA